MAGGLNREFVGNPIRFLQRHKFNVRGAYGGGAAGQIGSGERRLQFKDHGGLILLEPFNGPPTRSQHPFEAYFLAAIPNGQSHGDGLALLRSKYFFTATLSGCQFLIHGNSPRTLLLSHNNALDQDAAIFNQFLNAVPQASAVRISIQPGQNNPAPINGMHGSVEYDHEELAGNVVGVRGPNGWQVYWQVWRPGPGGANPTVTPLIV